LADRPVTNIAIMPRSDIQPRIDSCGELAMNVLVSHITNGSDAALDDAKLMSANGGI
jgi:hypothetical protein